MQRITRLAWLWIAMLALGVWMAGCAVATPKPTATETPTLPTTTPAAMAPAPHELVGDAGRAPENLRALLARQLHLAETEVAIVAAEPQEWPNACLGAPAADEMCAQVVTPGYRVTLSAAGQIYTFHADRDGYRSRLVAAPGAEIGEAVIHWKGSMDDGSCRQATIGSEGVSFAPCGGMAMGGHFVSPARRDALRQLADRYAPFTAETEHGAIEFAGRGETTATPEEQRMLAQWARTVAMEAAAGQSMASLTWRGPAEMGSPDTSRCASLAISGGQATLGACDGSATTVDLDKRLSGVWKEFEERLAPFEYTTPTETLIFEGMGTVSGEAWQRAVLAWARVTHAELASGRVSAAARTVASLFPGQLYDRKNVCTHLTVLDYGYAYAELIPCEGTGTIEVVGGWLETDELAQFDQWLYGRAPFYLDKEYIAGQGEQPLTEEEIAEARQWARRVWSWLQPTMPMPGE